MLKMRRLRLPAISVASGLVLLLLTWLTLSSAADRLASEENMEMPWREGVIGDATVTMTLVLPTLAIIVTALCFFVEHRNDMWKQLRATPRPRWTVLAAKFLVVQALIALALLVAWSGAAIAWPLLPEAISAELASSAAQARGATATLALRLHAALLPVALAQFLLSARMPNILHPVGIGLALTFSNLMLMAPQTNHWLPYAYPGAVIMRTFAAPAATATRTIAAMSGPDGQAPGTHVDPAQVVREVRAIVAERYVVAATRPAIDKVLLQGLSSGRYSVTDPRLLAQRVNEDLFAAAHDRHLSLVHRPAASAGSDQGPRPRSGATARGRAAQARNHGIVDMHLLDGNVRTVVVESFQWTGPETAEAYDTAMRFLAGADAAIIDIRRNGGGDPKAVHYLVSHFVDPGRLLVTYQLGRAGRVEQVTTLATLPAGRMQGKPLYVLTSGRTASAAEEFAGHISGFRLGELVGETTAGAAFRNETFALGTGLTLSVSVGRPVLAATGGDWEGRGIAPTVPTSADDALETAHLRALRRLAETAPAAERRRLISTAAALQRRMR